MNTAIELLKIIGKDNIDINSKSLISSGELDSLDIMALVDAIEEKFNKSLDADFIEKSFRFLCRGMGNGKIFLKFFRVSYFGRIAKKRSIWYSECVWEAISMARYHR